FDFATARNIPQIQKAKLLELKELTDVLRKQGCALKRQDFQFFAKLQVL
ncbi:MAG: hypothetical protein ACI9HK_001706, partial [Pirellulaceae bacterium]